jgi:hypothetical protein
MVDEIAELLYRRSTVYCIPGRGDPGPDEVERGGLSVADRPDAATYRQRLTATRWPTPTRPQSRRIARVARTTWDILGHLGTSAPSA